ncbi:3'-5' exoribonuclease YhaM family protein [Novipirellula artificiosorum]|uniref:3'-5' exoribonuclease YhaM n=1 Tax=Novipirellula artificiosorum TaxID=2528016 RepID=A0A5C6E2H0_9BACT|nr:OB-fold nucleic acid binding domain-containing protein [Novipirellula artificiosorum]TWU42177.1 3'-5' exoribonuclease YhaM [Novipirellula artificiosorum]
MIRTPISELADGQTVEQSFRAADKQLRVNRQGGKYIILKLADRSGTLSGMLWNADERVFDSFDRGDYVFCIGRTQIHNGALQMIVTEVQRMDPAEVERSEFERFDADESQRLRSQLVELLGGLNNVHLRQLGEAFLGDDEFMSRLIVGAAAVTNHHAYPGGLLRHTVDLMELAQLVGPRYPQIDTELLIFGAFLHDLGKLEELSCEGEASYTDRGQLVGHIVIGVQMLDEKIRTVESANEAFPVELRLQLEHLIVSHHGHYEFGSPKLPVTLEALTLHHLDNLDAKIESYTTVIESDVAADGNWTNYNPAIGRKLWKKRD